MKWIRSLALALAMPQFVLAADRTGSETLTIKTSRTTGLATFVTAAQRGAIPVTPGAGQGRIEAMDFVRAHGHVFGVKDPAAELKLDGIRTDRLGHTHTTYRQVHKDVSVFSGVLKIHQDSTGAILAANGDFYPSVAKVNPAPALTAADAVAIAQSEIARGPLAVERSELVIVDPGWYGDPPRGAHLAYYVILTDFSAGLREALFIDAHSGLVLDRWDVLHTGLDRRIWDDLASSYVRLEGQGPTGDAEVNEIYDYSGDMYGFLLRAFGRDGYDDAGGNMEATVHSLSPGCPNAWGGGGYTTFCTNITCDDVVAHEWGHSLTNFTANLIYQNQPGQINESYSDIWGELVDLFNGNAAIIPPDGGASWPTPLDYVGPGTDTPNDLRTFGCPGIGRWLVFEDCSGWGGAIRDMWDPTCYGDPDTANSPLQTCDSGDNGGVHSGSGIPNRAFALVTDGKGFPQNITAIGPIKAGAVWYRALTTYLTPASDFQDAYYGLNQAAADLVASGAFIKDPRDGSDYAQLTEADAEQIDKALLVVQMNTDGRCGASALVADPAVKCSGGTPGLIYEDDFESGVNGWTVSHTGSPTTPYDWYQVSAGWLPDPRPGTVWFVEDPNIGDCDLQDEAAIHSLFSPSIALPADLESPGLSFTHFLNTELTWDGGNLRISVNGGPWTLIPGSAFSFNPYNTTLTEIGTNPLRGQEAFTGLGGWGTSVIDLTGLVSGGDEVQFRFDFGKDGCIGEWGWLVDDFELYACSSAVPEPPVADPSGFDKNRYVSFSLPESVAGSSAAVRVRLVSLQHPDPANLPQFPESDFTAWESEVRWVGAPQAYPELLSPATFFTGAPLQCDPHYRDWSPSGLIADGLPEGLIHVYGEEIVPSSTYDVQAITAECPTGDEGCYSSPLAVYTARWGDVAAPFQAPSPAGLSQPDFFDVSAVIDKWQNTNPAAPITALADLDPQVPNQALSFFDISAVIDAWSSLAYPYEITTTCP